MSGKQIDLLAAGIVDSSGNVLQSGTVELYEAGTSTPVTGYSDAALGSSLGSTITLDSRGAKLVFVDGLVDLKLIIKNSDGDTIATYDGLDYDASGESVVESDPEILLHNTDQEDTYGGRNCTIRFKGEQSGGEQSTLATIIASHDSSADDQKGLLEFATNATSDNDSPSNKMYLTSSGYLGLGVASPFGEFHVRSAASGASAVNANADEAVLEGSGNAGMTILSGTTSNSNIFMGDTDDTDIGGVYYNNTSDTLAMRAGTVDGLTMTATKLLTDSALSVGIGETTPGGKLHVKTADVGAVTPDAGADEVIIEGTGAMGMTLLGSTTGSCNIALGDSDDADIGAVWYDNNTDVLYLRANTTNVVSVNSSGNVGVNIVQGFGKFHVASASSGASAVSADADEIIAEGSGNAGITILSGASSNSNLFMGDSGDTDIGGVYYNNTNNILVLRANTTDVVQVKNDGNTLLSGGLRLSAQDNAANTLDDYEEGTWTPTLENIGTGTYTANEGNYTKIGNTVVVQGRVDINTVGSASGDVRIAGLPFTVGYASGTHSPVAVTRMIGWSSYTGTKGYVDTTVVAIISDAGTPASHADMSTGEITFTLVYGTQS